MHHHLSNYRNGIPYFGLANNNMKNFVLGYATQCPRDASPFELPEWNACMVWVLNGSNRVVLQNFVYSHNDCTEEKLDYWAEYISKVWREPGTAKCCFQVSMIWLLQHSFLLCWQHP